MTARARPRGTHSEGFSLKKPITGTKKQVPAMERRQKERKLDAVGTSGKGVPSRDHHHRGKG